MCFRQYNTNFSVQIVHCLRQWPFVVLLNLGEGLPFSAFAFLQLCSFLLAFMCLRSKVLPISAKLNQNPILFTKRTQNHIPIPLWLVSGHSIASRRKPQSLKSEIHVKARLQPFHLISLLLLMVLNCVFAFHLLSPWPGGFGNSLVIALESNVNCINLFLLAIILPSNAVAMLCLLLFLMAKEVFRCFRRLRSTLCSFFSPVRLSFFRIWSEGDFDKKNV